MSKHQQQHLKCMSKPNKQLKLVVKNGAITSVYDDALVPLIQHARRSETKRASHVEPRGLVWDADLSPIGGPLFAGFKTRQEALDAEVYYLNNYYLESL